MSYIDRSGRGRRGGGGAKKETGWGVEQKRQWIEPSNVNISIARQCELLGLNRSSLYYQAKGHSQQNLLLMRLIDEQYTKRPFFGSPKITDWLRKQGHQVNHKRVERLMREMGLQAICPKRRLSQPAAGHRIYPYLLRDVPIVRPNQVWSTDITYIRLVGG